MKQVAQSTFIDPTGTVHVFNHIEDRAGTAYQWVDITGHQVAFMRGHTMDFNVWVAEVVRGICLAAEVI